MTNNNDFLAQNQAHHNGFLMNGTNNSLINSLNTAGSGSGGSTVGVSVNSTQSTGTGGVNSANNSLNNGYGGSNFGVPVQKQFDTESVLSIKSERVGLGVKTNLPNLYMPNGLGRTHSSLSHYNNSPPVNSTQAGQQQQFVNYGFIGPANTTNNKLSAIFPVQYQQQQLQNAGSQGHVYFPSPQLSTTNRFNQLSNLTAQNGSVNNLSNNNLPKNLTNLANNLSNSQQNSPSSIHQPFNSMSNIISSNQAQFSSMMNNQFADQNQFNNMTMNNRQRSVGRLERRVINNNFKNNNGFVNKNYSSAMNSSSAANNFDDNQSFFNDACTAITGNTSEHSFAMDSEYKLHYKGNLNGLFSEQYTKNCLKTIKNLNNNNDEQLSISSTTSGNNYRIIKCQLLLSKFIVNTILLIAYLTPLLIILLPKVNLINCKVNFDNYHLTNGDGSFISLIVKLIILKVAFFALFSRANGQKILYPRFALYKLALISLTFMVTLVFWLVFFVRIAERKFSNQEVNYLTIINYSVNFVDCLNLLFFLAVILIEIKHQKTEYFIKITRNPDGETHVYSLGDLSIQRAAVYCLEMYYRDFTVFNRLNYHKQQQSMKKILESNCQRSKCCGEKKRSLNKLNLDSNGLPTIKYYDIDIDKPLDKNASSPGALSDLELLNKNITENPLSEQLEQLDEELNGIDSDGHTGLNTEKLALPMKNMHFMANKRMHEENDLNRKLRKRSTRLELAIHHSFNLLRRTDEYAPNINTTAPMECNEAASTVFPFFAKSLQKYLKTTRQQLPQLLPTSVETVYPEQVKQHLNDSQEDQETTTKQPQQIIQYLATCLKYDLSPLVFLRRFQSKSSRVYETQEEDLFNEMYNQEKSEQSRKADKDDKNPLANYSNWSLICDELSNRMVRHGTEFLLRKDDISLYVTISKLPDFALSEEVINPNCNKFVLSSETCV